MGRALFVRGLDEMALNRNFNGVKFLMQAGLFVIRQKVR